MSGRHEDTPPRRSRHDSTPPRRQQRSERNDSPEPARRSSEHQVKSRRDQQNISERSKARSRSRSPARMSSGAAAGLQTAAQVSADLARRRAEELERLSRMRSEDTGRNAATVYRDAQGRRVDPAELRDTREADRERRNLQREEHKRVEREWAKGSRQKQDREDERANERRVAEEKFARSRNDERLNEEQRSRMHWEDPMLQFEAKKRRRKDKKDGKDTKVVYNGPPPQPNRFNIPPGHRWDGVDRSNKFEERFFKAQNDRKARELQAYQWSTADM